MEDILKRLDNVETDVSQLKSNVSTILATIPHLATKSDMSDLRTEMAAGFGAIRAEMVAGLGSAKAEMVAGLGSVRAEMATGFGSLRTEIATGVGALRTEIAAREAAFIKWMIATVLTVAGVAFTIAKFVH